MARLILFNKPYGVLSQFTSRDGHTGLADWIPVTGVYPAGRLDRDSEGLLLLTDDGSLQHRLTAPSRKLWKTYWVQVEGIPSEAALKQLANGITLKDGPTLPARVKTLSPPSLWPRNPPVRQRRNIPDRWLEIQIHEGRNRQIRRMTAAIGHPTLRLVRTRIGDWSLGDLQPGQWREEQVHLPVNNRKTAAWKGTGNRKEAGKKPRYRSQRSSRS